jgi:hypothetical protein
MGRPIAGIEQINDHDGELRMKLMSKVLLTAIAVLATGAAYAQNRAISTTLTPLSNSISYSELAQTSPARPALTAYVGYLVSVQNVGGNTLNKVRFEGTALAALGTNLRPVAFAPSTGSPCQAGTTPVTVVCELGQLRAGSAPVEFVVFFVSPLALTPLPPPTSPEQLQLQGKTYFAEGTNDASDLPNDVAPSVPELSAVALGTNSPVRVKSGVRKNGGSIFTGTGAPDSVDSFASLLSVPALPNLNYGVAELVESKPALTGPDACPPGAPNCLDIVDVNVLDKDGGDVLRFTATSNPETQYLLITLRRDASVFTGSARNITVYYQSVVGGNWEIVPPCAQVPDPLVFPNVDRCVYGQPRVFKRNDPEVRANASLLGDAEVRILAKENGRLSW